MTTSTRLKIGKEIKDIRVSLNLSQPGFRDLFNSSKPEDVRSVTQQDISKYENGQAGIKVEVLEHMRSLI